MSKFFKKFDNLLAEKEKEKCNVTEMKKQMKQNKVMMKICIDIELGLVEMGKIK